MKVLFLSWGVLPQKTGGLEKVTYYVLKYLDSFNQNVILVIPNLTKEVDEFWKNKLKNSKIIGLNMNIGYISVYSDIFKYIAGIKDYFQKKKFIIDYKRAVEEYKNRLIELIKKLNINFDVIYSYDWLTLPAAIELKKLYKKPLVVHFHSTAYDRTGGNSDVLKYLDDYDIEREGCKVADKVIVLSNRMKEILVNYYGCDPNKIYIVYNAPDDNVEIKEKRWAEIKDKFKIVLYLGRLTLHKGPDWLLKAAKRVLEKRKDVLFIFAGTGEMYGQLIKMAADMKISKNVIFTGWIDDDLAEFLYDITDVFVLPSVSEPFGLTPFEALARGDAVVITKQSGVSEVLKSAAKVDFWDVNKMSDYILAFLEYPSLSKYEVMNCLNDMKKLTWEDSTKRILNILSSVV